MGFVLRGAADIVAVGGIVSVVDEWGTSPCRRCLRDAEPGERVALVSYDPFTVDSPYRSASPAFVHVDGCEPYEGAEVPEQQLRRLLSVRSFDQAAMMLDAEVIAGTDLAQRLDTMFDNAATAFVHVHNAGPGCFAVRAVRD
jgi:hypothetical protein